MSASVLPRPVGSRPAGAGGIRLGIILALAAWFVLVVLLGASGAFVGRPGRPPVAIAIGAGTPLLLFFACLRFSSSFRAYVHSLDLRLITGMQAWRWAGMGFLALYAHDVLPAMFALPAGFGDMAVGFVAGGAVLVVWRWLYARPSPPATHDGQADPTDPSPAPYDPHS